MLTIFYSFSKDSGQGVESWTLKKGDNTFDVNSIATNRSKCKLTRQYQTDLNENKESAHLLNIDEKSLDLTYSRSYVRALRVDFTNILHAAFSYKSFVRSFFVLTF